MSQVVKFTLKDGAGDVHEYTVMRHGAVEGQDVMWQLVALGAEPIARIAQIALVSGNIRELIDADSAKLEQMLGGADFSTVGADVRKAIVATNMSKLAREVLRHTSRDDKPLHDNIAFGNAYSGNYGELLQAVWRVVQTNRFLPLPGTS